MDPNLTLAHITHNTSMIMLHHPIAFPPQEWSNYVALPRDCSAQTCELAAIETSNIVQKFLAHTPIPFVNTQFAFCTYVAAKALLFDHQATGKQLRPEFQNLLGELWEMSQRWKGKHNSPKISDSCQDSQAAMYARHLELLLDACSRDPQLKFDMYDNTCNPPSTQEHVSPFSTASSHQQQAQPFVQHQPPHLSHMRNNSLNSTSSAISHGIPTDHTTRRFSAGFTNENPTRHATTDTSPSYHVAHTGGGYLNHSQPMYDSNSALPSGQSPNIPHTPSIHRAHDRSIQEQSLLNLSDTFMDAQFLDMDRVITFEDANFYMPYGTV
jgi:hypothetical protein